MAQAERWLDAKADPFEISHEYFGMDALKSAIAHSRNEMLELFAARGFKRKFRFFFFFFGESQYSAIQNPTRRVQKMTPKIQKMRNRRIRIMRILMTGMTTMMC